MLCAETGRAGRSDDIPMLGVAKVTQICQSKSFPARNRQGSWRLYGRTGRGDGGEWPARWIPSEKWLIGRLGVMLVASWDAEKLPAGKDLSKKEQKLARKG